MGFRRKSRELAMQALFYMDIRKLTDKEHLKLFRHLFLNPEDPDYPQVEPFFTKVVDGVLDHRAEIDREIESFSANWKISRMSCVDRNVMRMAIFEMQFCDDIPDKVSINEAIDIGKRFGSRDSGAFINGILDSYRKSMQDPPDRTGQIESD